MPDGAQSNGSSREVWNMGMKNLEAAINLWASADQVQRQSLMRRFLEIQGELTSNNDFVGFLIAESGLDTAEGGAGEAGSE